MKKNKKQIIIVAIFIISIVLIKYNILESNNTVSSVIHSKRTGEMLKENDNNQSNKIDHSDMGSSYEDDYQEAINVTEEVNKDNEINEDVIEVVDGINSNYVAFNVEVNSEVDIYNVNDKCDLYYRVSKYNEIILKNVTIVSIKDSSGNRYNKSSEKAKYVNIAVPREIYMVLLRGRYVPNNKYVLFKSSSSSEEIELTTNKELLNYIDVNSKFKVTD